MGQLGVLGLEATGEAAYEELVDRPSATAAELADALGLSTARLQPVLQDLVGRGLVTLLAGRPTRYTAVAPDQAVEALARGAEEAIARARIHAAELARRARAARSTSPADLVEVIEGADAIMARVRQVQEAARDEVRLFDRPPYLNPRGENPFEAERIAAGVTYRAVYERALLDDTHHVARISRCLDIGEQARVLPGVPLKLMIVDRDVALVPLMGGSNTEVAVASIRPSVLLDSMVAMFETLWHRAVPLRPGFVCADVEDVAPEVRQILGFLGAGMKDEVIARHLGVNVRTVGRRVRNALDALGVETRFQAGVKAAELGLFE